MRPYLALAAAVAATAGLAPAEAATYPFCATRLTEAPTGTAASCVTSGPGQLGNRNVALRRTVTIEVAAGAVDATLTCDGTTAGPVRVSGPEPQEINWWGGTNCVARIVAVVDHTTAVATSTFNYVIILD